MKIDCEIIKDLLPLYHDNICSAASRQAVEEHLKECEHCQKLLWQINEDVCLPKKEVNELAPLAAISRRWQKMQQKVMLKGIAGGILVFLLLAGAFYGSTQLNVQAVKTEDIIISDISRLANGNIAFHLYIDDDYDLHEIRCTVTDDGEMYITPKRPLIKSKRDADFPNGLYDRAYAVKLTLDSEESYADCDFSFIKDNARKVYVGTPKDRILIWQEGDILPAAAAEMEAIIAQQ